MREMKQKMSSWMKLVSAMLVVAFAITLLAPAGKGFIAYAEEATTQVAQQTEEETTEQQKTEEQKAQEEAEAAEQARAKKWKKILIGGLVVGGVLVVLAAAGNSGNTGRVETSSGTKTSTSTSNNALTVVDNDECSIRITGTENSVIWGKGVKVTLKNKTSDKNYMFTLKSAAINGIQVTDIWAEEVTAGKQAYSTIYFSLSDEEKKQIGTYKEIELTFWVYDYDNWSAPDVANVTVTYYP
jgi:type II secretory pathway pseudopilin PulG